MEPNCWKMQAHSVSLPGPNLTEAKHPSLAYRDSSMSLLIDEFFGLIITSFSGHSESRSNISSPEVELHRQRDLFDLKFLSGVIELLFLLEI